MPPAVTLEADGLGLVDFGQPAEAVLATLTRRLGTPEENAYQPCERDAATQTRWVRWADLSVRLAADGFAAYIEGVHYPPGREALDFPTTRGLSPGDPLERLRRLYGDRVRISAASPVPGRPATATFRIKDGHNDGVVSGVIEQPKGPGIVTAIFAGKLC